MRLKKIVKILIIGLIILTPICLLSLTTSMWVTSWDLTSPERIDQIVNDAEAYDFDRIMAEIRYRGDALYIPNKTDSTFRNQEPRCYLLSDSTNWDPLEYLLEQCLPKEIEVHAWLTTFVATTRNITVLDSTHIYYLKPEWITYDYHKRSMDPDSHEGAFLDPGIPAVHNYLLNVIMDIAANYQLAGIHLDYIRYPGPDFGYSKLSRQLYEIDTQYEDPETWKLWKEDQISDFVKKVSLSLKNNYPEMLLTTAVFSSLETARNSYSQNWYQWLAEDYVDEIYLMAYTKDNELFESIINKAANLGFNKKIVIGLRAWDSENNYPVAEINKKIKLSKKKHFAGLSFFSYSGMKSRDYFKRLHF